MNPFRLLSFALTFTILARPPLVAQTLPDPAEVSLEDLMKVQVTTVSKKEQQLARAGASVHVIGREEIRRSGANNIPDLLRTVPGASVAQVDGNKWAVSIRGFSGVYANKVLVLIDGRSVYSPTFSGVFWYLQDVPLEDIDRIEVIRGPGGTIWGANAVNGVINILTKRADETQGGLVTMTGGTQEFLSGTVRYGGAAGRKGAYRIFGTVANMGDLPKLTGGSADDSWKKAHAGFRSDWKLSENDSLTVQGDLLEARVNQNAVTPVPENQYRFANIVDRVPARNGSVLARWSRTLRNGHEWSLQGYYDYVRKVLLGSDMARNIVDFDFQYRMTVDSRNDVVWGAGYRVARDNLRDGYIFRFQPRTRTDSLYSAFAQDEIRPTNSLSLTIGSKFEHNAYTGLEFEPGAQIVWSITPRHTLWASAAQAIRQPSRIDTNLESEVSTEPIDGGGTLLIRLVPNARPVSERMRGFEIGYRTQLNRRLSFDASGFSNYYSRVQTTSALESFFEPSPSPYLVLPIIFDYRGNAHTQGAELSITWTATRRLQLSSDYSLLQMHMGLNPGVTGAALVQSPGFNPRHQVQVRSQYDLGSRLEWDTTFGRVGHLNGDPGADLSTPPIPGYTRLDTRIGWKVSESFELSLVGQNLISPLHTEFPDQGGSLSIHSEIPRRVFAKLTWRF